MIMRTCRDVKSDWPVTHCTGFFCSIIVTSFLTFVTVIVSLLLS